MDAFGRDTVMLESMGVGQVETRVRFAAETVGVVLTPESGDDVQAQKSGLLEDADVLVVNKSDRPGADALAADLTAIVKLRESRAWTPPVVQTAATEARGIEALDASMEAHRAHLETGGRRETRRREALGDRVRFLLEEEVRRRLWRDATLRARFDGILEAVVSGRTSPYRAARELVDFKR
jgi:LAO/AO transport system kinase